MAPVNDIHCGTGGHNRGYNLYYPSWMSSRFNPRRNSKEWKFTIKEVQAHCHGTLNTSPTHQPQRPPQHTGLVHNHRGHTSLLLPHEVDSNCGLFSQFPLLSRVQWLLLDASSGSVNVANRRVQPFHSGRTAEATAPAVLNSKREREPFRQKNQSIK